MKIQLLNRTVKLRIDRHIIVIPREKDNMHNYPHGFQGAFKVKHFAVRFLENMKSDFKKTNPNCSHIINGFL